MPHATKENKPFPPVWAKGKKISPYHKYDDWYDPEQEQDLLATNLCVF